MGARSIFSNSVPFAHPDAAAGDLLFEVLDQLGVGPRFEGVDDFIAGVARERDVAAAATCAACQRVQHL
jgi:hypothetical protein